MRLLRLLANLRRSRGRREDFFINTERAPRYVAIIMDGNGRWAARRRLPAIAGHREGSKALKRIIASARRSGIEELTVYAFSTENWQRSREEVDALMGMFSELIKNEVPELHRQEVRVRFIGRRSDLADGIRADIDWAEELTAANGAMTLYVAFNYGGRAEIADALKAAVKDGKPDISEEELGSYLYAPEMHDPELLIRTSGERRLSNFLLWQCAYSELYFTEKLWPDFGEEDFAAALAEFSRRQRRFGAR